MKKIITAAAIAAMAAGFATAEAKFTVNYRTGIMAVDHTIRDNYGDSHGTTFLSNQNSGRKTADALSFKGSADYGGLELEIDPTVNTSGGWLTDKNGTIANKYVTLEKYNGWINFGNFMIKSGTWDGRGVGRVNASANDHEGKWFGEIQKPGLANKLGTEGKGVDISQQSNKVQTTMVQYKNNDLGLEARVAYTDKDGTTTTYNSANYGTNSDDESDYKFANESWLGELGYTIKGVGRILGTTKLMHNDYAFAAFFEPKLDNVKALTSLIGFIAETDKKGYKQANGDWETLNAYAVEARARYNLADAGIPLAVTFMYNWTFGEVANNTGKSDKVHGAYATWGMVNFLYNLNDTFHPFLSVIYTSAQAISQRNTKANVAVSTANVVAFDDPYNFSMRFYAGTEICNTASARITTGVVLDATNMMERSTTTTSVTGAKGEHGRAGGLNVSIPVLFRVKF